MKVNVKCEGDSGGETILVDCVHILHPNSGIVQELSEAIDSIFRKQMDAVEDPLNEADLHPAKYAAVAFSALCTRAQGACGTRVQ